MFSLSGQSRSGGSCMRKVRRGVAAALVGCLAVSGCSGGKPEGQGADGSESGSPFAAPEDSTPTVPEYKVEDGLVLSADDKRLADEAVVFFTEYMAAANRAYKDGGVYWDKLIDMSSGPLREAQKDSRREAETNGIAAKNDLKTTQLSVGSVDQERAHVFLTVCMHYDEWSLSGAQNEQGDRKGERVVAGFDVLKQGEIWTADELSSVESKCA